MADAALELKKALEREGGRREQAEEEEQRVKGLLAKEKQGAQNLRERLDLESTARIQADEEVKRLDKELAAAKREAIALSEGAERTILDLELAKGRVAILEAEVGMMMRQKQEGGAGTLTGGGGDRFIEEMEALREQVEMWEKGWASASSVLMKLKRRGEVAAKRLEELGVDLDTVAEVPNHRPQTQKPQTYNCRGANSKTPNHRPQTQDPRP